MNTDQVDPSIASALEPDEEVRAHARSTTAVLAVTTRRVVVAEPYRVHLAVPIENVRRIQFDLERRRPATLVIVPEHPSDEPQVLSIPPEHYRSTADALVALGNAFSAAEPSGPDRQPEPR